VLEDYRNQIFTQEGDTPAAEAEPPPGSDEPGRVATDNPAAEEGPVLPATALARAAWHTLINGGFEDLASLYVFDVRPLTNDRPYFAAYVKPGDLPKILDRLDLFQDEWGYLLLWATLCIAAVAALSLVLFRSSPDGARSFRTIRASSAPSSTLRAWAPATSWSRWA